MPKTKGFTLTRKPCESGFTLIRTRFQRNLDNAQGFTLIELLIVIVIIGLLVTFFISTYPSAGERARDAQRRSDIKQYQTALESYSFANDGEYPDTPGPISTLCTQLQTPSCPKDPQTGEPGKQYNYETSSPHLNYYLWVKLEKRKNKDGEDFYFIVCSEGAAEDKPLGADPTGDDCPI